MPLLTRVEHDFLLGHRQFTRDQQYYIRSRLLKKLKTLYGVELPLLVEKGFVAACSKDLAAGCKVSDRPRPRNYETERSLIIGERDQEEKSALVAQPAERRFRKP